MESESALSCALFSPRSACDSSNSDQDSAEQNEAISISSVQKSLKSQTPNDQSSNKHDRAIEKQKKIIKELSEKIEFYKMKEQETASAI